MINTKQLHIFGGGLVGLQISLELSRILDTDYTSISLFDQANTILSAWSHQSISSINCNNGFHGIELPRASEVVQFLESNGCSDLLLQIPNYRVIYINDTQVDFNSSIHEWPQILSEGLDSFVDLSRKSDPLDSSFASKLLVCTNLGRIIAKIYHRFSDNIEDCWHLIYPWFFPKEFLFPGSDDEGSSFQNDVRNNKIHPSYVIPKTNIFSSLRAPLLSQLSKEKVNLNLEYKVEASTLTQLLNTESTSFVWCASSYSLLSLINKKFAQACIVCVRHMHLILFSIDYDSYLLWMSRLSSQPSEILFMSEDAPCLNRVSFPQQPLLHSKSVLSRVYILAECFLVSTNLDQASVSSVQLCLSKYFSADLKYEGSAYGRPMFTFSNEHYDEAVRIVSEFSSCHDLCIPNIYFGPINMAKCGIIAKYFLANLE